MKKSRKTGNENNEDKFEDAEYRAFKHAEQYNQSNIDVLELKAIERGRKT
jgi:hypothetical protein